MPIDEITALSDPGGEKLRKGLLALGIVFLLILLLASWAALVKAGAFTVSSSVLSHAFFAMGLQLATSLSMTTLGLPLLIALLAISAWLIALLLLHWDRNLATGWWQKLGGKGPWLGAGNYSTLQYAHVKAAKGQSDQAMLNYNIPVFFAILAEVLLFPLTIPRALLLLPQSVTSLSEQPPKPRGYLARIGLFVLNAVVQMLGVPFLALAVLMDRLWRFLQWIIGHEQPPQWTDFGLKLLDENSEFGLSEEYDKAVYRIEMVPKYNQWKDVPLAQWSQKNTQACTRRHSLPRSIKFGEGQSSSG